MYHTTYPIDAKIDPNFSLVAINFSKSFSNVILPFKGRLPNIFLQCL